MAQTIQYYPGHTIHKGNIRHPDELTMGKQFNESRRIFLSKKKLLRSRKYASDEDDIDHTPMLPNFEVMPEVIPDCDPRIFPPPRHPGRLVKKDQAMIDRPRPVPASRTQAKPVAQVVEAECEEETGHINTLWNDRPPTPHSKHRHRQRMKGSNGSLGTPRWSAFPVPPHELPQQPPPNKPLPQLPATPARSTRSRQSSGASKQSGHHDQLYSSSPCGHYDSNSFPPSPPQELPANFPFKSTFNAPTFHDQRSSSSHSSTTSSSNRTSSLTGFPAYSTSSLSHNPSFPTGDNGRMATLQELTLEDDPDIRRFASVSTRSFHSGDKQRPPNDRRISSSTNSSEAVSKGKKSGMLSSKGIKDLIRGKTPPLIEAVKSNDLKELLNLLAPGIKQPDINCSDRDNWTALHWAADLGHYDIAEILLARNAVTEARTKVQGRTPLYLAAAHGHAPLIRVLLENGAAVNAAGKMDGATAIHKAAQHGYTEAITALIAGKADVNKRDIEGMPPLMWATQRKQLHAAHKLVAAGADLAIRIKLGANLENSTYEGMTVLHKVARTGDVAFARLFLEHGADPDADAPQGFRALHNAASKGDLSMVKCLVEFGSDVNLRSAEGWMPLHFAGRHGHRKVATYLIQQGADKTMQTGKVGSGVKGDTPEQLARKHGFEDVIPG